MDNIILLFFDISWTGKSKLSIKLFFILYILEIILSFKIRLKIISLLLIQIGLIPCWKLKFLEVATLSKATMITKTTNMLNR